MDGWMDLTKVYITKKKYGSKSHGSCVCVTGGIMLHVVYIHNIQTQTIFIFFL